MKTVLINALNKQLNDELIASYNYLAMATYFEQKGLHGFSKWMLAQSEEERQHGMKFYTYLFDRNVEIALAPIPKPVIHGDSVKAIFEQSLRQEQTVTSNINEIVDLSIKEKDHATHVFLQWFVTEQVEEESMLGSILNKCELIGTEKAALYLLDKELGERAIT